MPSGPWTAFEDAAIRHYWDAVLLERNGRLGNADHLAGCAAECALKAILVSQLGGILNSKGYPTHPNVVNGKGKETSLGHLPDLWANIALAASGRNGVQFAALIAAPNPFASWDVSERYSDGKHISPARLTGHLAGAKKLIEIHQEAKIIGALP